MFDTWVSKRENSILSWIRVLSCCLQPIIYCILGLVIAYCQSDGRTYNLQVVFGVTGYRVHLSLVFNFCVLHKTAYILKASYYISGLLPHGF